MVYKSYFNKALKKSRGLCLYIGNVDLPQEEELAGHTFDLEVETACIRHSARDLRGGGGKGREMRG